MARPGPHGIQPTRMPELTDKTGRDCVNGRVQGSVCTPQPYILVGRGVKEDKSCTRGQVVSFSAKATVPHFQRCEWKITSDIPVLTKENITYPSDIEVPDDDEAEKPADIPHFTRSVVYTTTSVTFVALYSFAVELSVDNGLSAKIDITVLPRDWKKDVVLQKKTKKIFGEHLLANGGDKHLGSNGCTICNGQKSHLVHFDENSFAPIKKIKDPASVFSELCYFERLDFAIDRSVFLNSELEEGGLVYQLNQAKAEYKEALNQLVDSVREHETLHYDLMKAAWREDRVNPTGRLETALAYDEMALIDFAKTSMGLADSRLSDATASKEGHQLLREKVKKNLKGKDPNISILLPARIGDTQGVVSKLDVLDFQD